jgi:site-specific DNA-cytosine methylase
MGSLREHVRPGSNTDYTVVQDHATYRKATKAHTSDDWERWEPDDMTDSLTASGLTPRTDVAVVSPTLLAPGPEGGRRDKIPTIVQSLDTKQGGPDDNEAQAGHLVRWEPQPGWLSLADHDDPLLPLGLDSHRYRCCGNGVVAPVAEWLGERLAEAVA